MGGVNMQEPMMAELVDKLNYMQESLELTPPGVLAKVTEKANGADDDMSLATDVSVQLSCRLEASRNSCHLTTTDSERRSPNNQTPQLIAANSSGIMEDEEGETDAEGVCRPELAAIDFSGITYNVVQEASAAGRVDPESAAEGDTAANQRPSQENQTSQLLMQERSYIAVNCASTVEDEDEDGEETDVEGVCGPEFVTMDFSSNGGNRVPEAAGTILEDAAEAAADESHAFTKEEAGIARKSQASWFSCALCSKRVAPVQ